MYIYLLGVFAFDPKFRYSIRLQSNRFYLSNTRIDDFINATVNDLNLSDIYTVMKDSDKYILQTEFDGQKHVFNFTDKQKYVFFVPLKQNHQSYEIKPVNGSNNVYIIQKNASCMTFDDKTKLFTFKECEPDNKNQNFEFMKITKLVDGEPISKLKLKNVEENIIALPQTKDEKAKIDYVRTNSKEFVDNDTIYNRLVNTDHNKKVDALIASSSARTATMTTEPKKIVGLPNFESFSEIVDNILCEDSDIFSSELRPTNYEEDARVSKLKCDANVDLVNQPSCVSFSNLVHESENAQN